MIRRESFGLLALLLLALPGSVAAQAPISYTLKIFNQGAAAQISTTVLPAASWVCNQAVPPAPTAANPMFALFDDPANAGKVCIYTDSGAGPLMALPFGSGVYEARLALTNSVGTSADSAVSPPFTKPGAVGAVPTGLRVYR